MSKRFYNLPPAWDPGYADPESVRDEGLQRRAFVTAMTPRGTYDNPKVGSGGYALPNYVGKEGYGRGAYVTKWAPRGFYGTPVPNFLDRTFTQLVGASELKTGGVELKMSVLSGMGDTTAYPRNDMFGQFGVRAAAKIITDIMKLPPSQRRAAIKSALDQMDPALFGRAERYAKEAMAKGQSARAALAQGLAAAITEGMLLELKKSGEARRAPQANSLPGLGCYRKSSLGALGQVSSKLATVQQMHVSPTAVMQTTPPTRRTMRVLQVGPFKIPVDEKSVRLRPQDIGTAAFEDMSKQMALRGFMRAILDYDIKISQGWVPTANYGLPWGIAEKDGKANGKPVRGGAYVYGKVIRGETPIYYFEHPDSGKRHGIYATWVGTLARPEWRITWKQNEPGTITKLFDGMVKLVAKIIDITEQIVDAVADMACDLVNNPNAAGAAQAASGTGAAVGVGIAQGMCSKPGGSSPPPPPPSSNMNTIVLLGAGALLVAALVKKKRKS